MAKQTAKLVTVRVQISPKLHKKLKGDAKRFNLSLNSTMTHLLKEDFKSHVPPNLARLSGPTWGTGESALEQLLRVNLREEASAGRLMK